MKSFFHFFAKRSTLANVFTFMVILIGINTFMSVQRAQYPTVDFGEMLIITEYPGASAEDVELNVTNKLEDELKGVSGIKFIDSFSRENVSTVHIMIEPDEKDTKKVKDDIREAVSRVTDLPVEVTKSPTIMDFNTSMFPIIEVGLSSKDMPYAQLREYARLFEKKLKNIPGVSGVTRFGYRDREVKIEVSPDKLRSYGVALSDIIWAVRNRNIRVSGGTMESYTSAKNVVTMAQFGYPEEVGEVFVRSDVKIADLATITNDFEETKTLSHMNGKPAISFIVTKSESADIIRTNDDIKKLIAAEQEYLPQNVEILYSTDISRGVRNQFNIVKNNAIIGLVLVVLLLALFLNIHSAFWVAMGIPVSIFTVVSLLPLFDTFLDSITLTAMVIVIGIVVDDGIIVSENIMHRRELGDAPLDAAVNGISGVFQPVMTTLLTTIIAFAPMFFMSGMLGKFVYVIPLTVTLSLLASLVEIIVALPAHMIPGLHKVNIDPKCCGGTEWFTPVRNKFKVILSKLLKFRYVVVIIAILTLILAFGYAYKNIPFILTPSEIADRFLVVLELPIGSSLEANTDSTTQVEKIIKELPKSELDSFVTRIGESGDGFITANKGEHLSMIDVVLSPYSRRERSADEIVEELRQKVSKLGLFEKTTFTIMSGGPPVGKPVVIRVAGIDDNMRTRLTGDLVNFLSTIDGVKDIERDDKSGKDQVNINIDYYELARLGLTVSEIAQNVRIAYDGEVVSNIRRGDEDIDFRVQLSKEARRSLKHLKELSLPNKDGKFVSLAHVASLDIASGPADFHHYDGDRIITVTADVDQDKTNPTDVTNLVNANFDLNRDYPGARFIVGGEAQETSDSMASLIRVFLIAVIGMYLLLFLLFDSATQPLMVIIAIPFGFCGVILAFALHGNPFSFLAMIGSIGLAGIVVNDSLVLVDHINNLRKEFPERPMLELICNGTTERLRPIIMTSITTIAGLLPLTYGIGGVDAYMAPMAMALGYGLLFATPVTLILLPSLFAIADDIRKKIKL